VKYLQGGGYGKYNPWLFKNSLVLLGKSVACSSRYIENTGLKPDQQGKCQTWQTQRQI
jgi:hypothetical protein